MSNFAIQIYHLTKILFTKNVSNEKEMRRKLKASKVFLTLQ